MQIEKKISNSYLLSNVGISFICIYVLVQNILPYIMPNSTFYNLLEILIAGGAIFFLSLERRHIFNTGIIIGSIIIVSLLITTCLSASPIQEISISKRYIIEYIWIIFLFTTKFEKKDIKYILNFYYINNIVIMLLIIMRGNIFFTKDKYIYYLGQFINTNAIPYFIGFGFAYSVYRSLYTNKRKNVDKGLAFGFAMVLIFTKSSAAFFIVLLIVSILVSGYLKNNFKLKKKISLKNLLKIMWITTAIGLISVLIYQLIPQQIWDRVARLDDNGRFALFKNAYEYYRNGNRLVGSGFGALRNISINFDGYGCHNLFLNLLVATGTVGCLFNVILIGYLIYTNKSYLGYALLGIIMIGGMVEGGMSYFLGVSMTICIIISKKNDGNLIVRQ